MAGVDGNLPIKTLYVNKLKSATKRCRLVGWTDKKNKTHVCCLQQRRFTYTECERMVIAFYADE